MTKCIKIKLITLLIVAFLGFIAIRMEYAINEIELARDIAAKSILMFAKAGDNAGEHFDSKFNAVGEGIVEMAKIQSDDLSKIAEALEALEETFLKVGQLLFDEQQLLKAHVYVSYKETADSLNYFHMNTKKPTGVFDFKEILDGFRSSFKIMKEEIAKKEKI